MNADGVTIWSIEATKPQSAVDRARRWCVDSTLSINGGKGVNISLGNSPAQLNYSNTDGVIISTIFLISDLPGFFLNLPSDGWYIGKPHTQHEKWQIAHCFEGGFPGVLWESYLASIEHDSRNAHAALITG